MRMTFFCIQSKSFMEDIKKIRKRPLNLKEMDTLQVSKGNSSGIDSENKAEWLLDWAMHTWNNLDDFRRQRSRAYRFVYGDQLGDPVTVYIDGEKKTISQREYLAMEGHVPMQSNQLASKVNTIVGVFIKEQNEPVVKARAREEQQYGELLTAALQANCDKNRMSKINKSCVIDHVCGGLALTKEHWGYFRGVEDSWTDYINPNFFFFESGMSDPRLWDAVMLGCWYYMPKEILASKFVKSRKDLDVINKIYPQKIGKRQLSGTMITDIQDTDRLSFMNSPVDGWCCVAEIWTKEVKEVIRAHDWSEGTLEVFDASDKAQLAEIEQINKERKSLAKAMGWAPEEVGLIDIDVDYEEYWYCRMLAPDGTILYEEESPYADKLHPFTVMVYPFMDGRISPYIADGIDHQIAINRALILKDWIARNQVKGFVMMPQELVPDGMTNEEFVQSSIKLGNFYFYDSSKLKGVMPQVFHPGAVSYNATDDINMYMKIFEESTAINGAMQGKSPHAGTSAALYAQQTANSATPLVSILEDIRTFLEDVATKKTKNIADRYTPERFERIAGSLADILGNENMKFDEVRNIEFDMAIKNGSATMVSRDAQNDQVIGFLNAGMIDLQTALEIGDFPYGDKLLQRLQARQAEVEAAQQQAGGSSGMIGAGGASSENAAKQIAEGTQDLNQYGLPVKSTRPLV